MSEFFQQPRGKWEEMEWMALPGVVGAAVMLQ